MWKRLELKVNDDSNSAGAGCYALLHNKHGAQRLVGITSGWSKLSFPADENASLTNAARFHPDQVYSTANWLLSDIQNPA